MGTLVYWWFCGSFVVALSLHLTASLLIGVWCFWREENLVDWHGNLMLAALLFGIGGTIAAYLLPTNS
ncbi:hypothetical protein [Gloeobacter violaceus]|uniref:Gsr1244 protein n=1 Tax=Gloeobacter violaceus (strain ATCC 29082 / PCC 7421) TaxID=251221 RepID=Q7NL82_GLOVI|nr:hypothetical protein [Gloeobacter violaceus]BAC89185.1 gsr1244 [Gloeobacter violaceus PCC 7421]